MKILLREFYLRNANDLAIKLLGKKLVHDTEEGKTSGIITEVEAYVGPNDRGSHAYLNKRTPRTEIQFGIGGFAYIYTIYGMHSCFNVVANTNEKPEVVLIRALKPLDGIELMQERRGTKCNNNLCNGPGKLCQSLGITKSQYGFDLCSSELRIEDFIDINSDEIMVSPRINIDYAGESKDLLWRYFIKDSKYVSKVPKKYLDKCCCLNTLLNSK